MLGGSIRYAPLFSDAWVCCVETWVCCDGKNIRRVMLHGSVWEAWCWRRLQVLVSFWGGVMLHGSIWEAWFWRHLQVLVSFWVGAMLHGNVWEAWFWRSSFKQSKNHTVGMWKFLLAEARIPTQGFARQCFQNIMPPLNTFPSQGVS